MPADAAEGAIAIGTLEYSAPEVLANTADIDWKHAEVWTLGVILLELVSPVWCEKMDTLPTDPTGRLLPGPLLKYVRDGWVSTACHDCRVQGVLHTVETAWAVHYPNVFMSADIRWRCAECREHSPLHMLVQPDLVNAAHTSHCRLHIQLYVQHCMADVRARMSCSTGPR